MDTFVRVSLEVVSKKIRKNRRQQRKETKHYINWLRNYIFSIM